MDQLVPGYCSLEYLDNRIRSYSFCILFMWRCTVVDQIHEKLVSVGTRRNDVHAVYGYWLVAMIVLEFKSSDF